MKRKVFFSATIFVFFVVIATSETLIQAGSAQAIDTRKPDEPINWSDAYHDSHVTRLVDDSKDSDPDGFDWVDNFKAQLAPHNSSLWTGIYAGGHIGGMTAETTMTGIAKSDFAIAPGGASEPGRIADVDIESLIVGGQVGYMHQFGRFVLGVDASYSAGPDKNYFASPYRGDPERYGNYQDTWSAGLQDIVLLQGRAGMAFGQVLAFAQGGAAFATSATGAYLICHVKERCYPGGGGDDQKDVNGWTLGGGLAYKPNDVLMFSLEYNYAEFGKAGDTIYTYWGGVASPDGLEVGKHEAHLFKATASIALSNLPGFWAGEKFESPVAGLTVNPALAADRNNCYAAIRGGMSASELETGAPVTIGYGGYRLSEFGPVLPFTQQWSNAKQAEAGYEGPRGLYTQPSGTTTLHRDFDDGLGGVGELAGGCTLLGPLRLEVAASGTFDFDHETAVAQATYTVDREAGSYVEDGQTIDVTEATLTEVTSTSLKLNDGRHIAAMVNGYLDIPLGIPRFTPFIGAGLGWSVYTGDAEVVHTSSWTEDIVGGEEIKGSDVTRRNNHNKTDKISTDGLAWSVAAGVHVAISDNMGLEVLYRYREIDYEQVRIHGLKTELDFSDQLVMAGVRMGF